MKPAKSLGPRTRGRPSKEESPGISREIVIKHALETVDREGMQALSIRRLAADLGVAPNSLYSYVEHKDDLIDGIFKHVIGDIEKAPMDGADWTERVATMCKWFRKRLLRHPRVIAAQGFRETFPLSMTPLIFSVGAELLEAGFDDEELVDTLFIIFYHVIGFVTCEVARQQHGIPTKSDEDIVDRAVTQDFDEHSENTSRLLPLVRNVDLDRAFDDSLSILLDGLAARLFKP